jgi:hypothetical protein
MSNSNRESKRKYRPLANPICPGSCLLNAEFSKMIFYIF